MTQFDFSAFDFSEGFTRLRQGFVEGRADQVPFIQQSHEFNMRHSGFSGREYYSNPEKLIYGAFKTAQDVGFETPDYCWDSYNIEAEAMGANLAMFEELTPAINNIEPLVRNERDLAKLRAPNPGLSGRMPFVFDVMSLYHELTGEVPSLIYCGPFTLATQIMTFEDVVLGMQDNPAFIHKVLTFVTEEVLAPYLNAHSKRFPDAISNGGDAVSSLPFITIEMLEEFSLQYIERLQVLTGNRAVVDNWWGDAHAPDLEQFWEMKLRATPPYLKVQDPDLFKVGAESACAFARQRGVPLMLGVSNNLLQDGPPEEIERRIHEYLEVLEPDGKSLLYLCNFSAEAPLEHVRAAVEAVQHYRQGNRPYAGDRLSGTAAAMAESSPRRQETGESQGKRLLALSGLSEDQELLLDDLFDAVVDGADAVALEGVRSALKLAVPVDCILDNALISAMEEVGQMFSDGTIFVPEMLLSARAMKGSLEILRPLLTKTQVKPKGTVMLATVQGDVHDIGKNLVGMMLEGAGFQVTDLGVNIGPEEAVARARELNPDVIGLSALLTTTMPQMGRIIDAFRKAGLTYPIIVGGAPVNETFAERIGADGYGADAPEAVELVKSIIAAQQGAAARQVA